MTTKHHFRSFLQHFVELYTPYLETQTEQMQREAEHLNPMSGELGVSAARLIRCGGKRIRPALIYLGYWLASGQKPEDSELEDIFLLGTAVEFLHTFALVHDDIIDIADTRRGEPTIEAEYRKRIGKHGATTAAILAGDFLHVYADKLASQLEYVQTRSDYFAMSCELVFGQIDDCLGVGLGDFKTIDQQRILAMLAAKSGNYSIQKPLLLGARLAEEKGKVQKESYFNSLEHIGRDLGLVFQHTDDLLGIFGSDDTGKSTDGDITEGKRTLLMARTVQAASVEVKEKLLQILGNAEAKRDEIDWVKKTVVELGIDADIRTECMEYMKTISEEIEKQWGNAEPAIILQQLGDYLLSRSS